MSVLGYRCDGHGCKAICLSMPEQWSEPKPDVHFCPTCSVKTIGDRIRSARRERGVTQTDLARQIGVTGASISFWERSLVSPRGEHREALERWLREVA